MLGATAFPIRKRYIVDGQAFYYRNAQHPGAPLKDVVQVYYQFKNDERHGPWHADAGRRRSRLSGRLERRRAVRRRGSHRPHAEGRNAQSQDRQRLRPGCGTEAGGLREDRQQRLRGGVRGDAAQPQAGCRSTVEVNEPIGGTWQILRSTHDGTKTDAWAARFEVPVAADGETTLKYRVQGHVLRTGLGAGGWGLDGAGGWGREGCARRRRPPSPASPEPPAPSPRLLSSPP